MTSLHLTRARELGERIAAIQAEVSSWVDEVPDASIAALQHASRVLAGLQSARTDLGHLGLEMADHGG